ncbi:MAG: hypothetical protein AAF548_06590 [Actinomycetota bacterium]
MTDLDRTDPAATSRAVDGRVARRERNIAAVLDVVLEMFAEEALFPTMEQVASRSGLSLRSLYRYFADPGELLEAVILRTREQGVGAATISGIGRGSLDDRIVTFVAVRLRLYERFGAVYRATTANAPRLERIREEQARTRGQLRDQLETQFAPELDRLDATERKEVVAAADLLTQFDAIDLLVRHAELTDAEIETTLRSALRKVLA